MKHKSIVLAFLFPLAAAAQHLPELASAKYSWVTPKNKVARELLLSPMLSGSSIDLASLQVDACSLSSSGKATSLQVPSDMEYLLILKSGMMTISFGTSMSKIGRGSVSILAPAEKFTIQASGDEACDFYLMKYKAADKARNTESTRKSFVTDWNDLEFKTHDKGGVWKYFELPTAMFQRLEMHVTTLNEGLKSHDPHTHRPGEIILIMDDEHFQETSVEMLIGDRTFAGGAGDLYYVEPNILHGITNTGPTACSYFAFQFQ